MQVILTKDVKGLGLEGDMTNVSDGYARNFLLPRKLSIIADKKNIAIWERKKVQREAAREELKQEKLSLAAKLKDLVLTIKADVGESGKLFGSVTSADIASAIMGSSSLDIDKKDIELPEHIKLVGAYDVLIHLHPEVSAKVKVDVQAK